MFTFQRVSNQFATILREFTLFCGPNCSTQDLSSLLKDCFLFGWHEQIFDFLILWTTWRQAKQDARHTALQNSVLTFDISRSHLSSVAWFLLYRGLNKTWEHTSLQVQSSMFNVSEGVVSLVSLMPFYSVFVHIVACSLLSVGYRLQPLSRWGFPNILFGATVLTCFACLLGHCWLYGIAHRKGWIVFCALRHQQAQECKSEGAESNLRQTEDGPAKKKSKTRSN